MGLSRRKALQLLNNENILKSAVSRVHTTPHRKWTHKVIPISNLIELCPELSNITQPGKLKIKK